MKKAVVLLSDGIDSPVACHLAMESGYEVIALTFDNYPYMSPVNLDITKRLVMKLSEIHEVPIKFYIIKNGENLSNIIESLSDKTRSYVCVLCKRTMMRLANEIADREGAEALVTGDNIGQVASQTLDNMITISKASKRHIVRPLLCMDKVEIENIAKEIGTYEISIEKKPGCSAVPHHPRTSSSPGKIEELENGFELVLEIE